MSQKTERPVLSGQRIKTRKRDEREKYDPTGFRDAVIAGLEKTEGDLEQISKYLDSAGNKLDYRRYGEVLFDILIAGGLLGKSLWLRRFPVMIYLTVDFLFFDYSAWRFHISGWRKAAHKLLHLRCAREHGVHAQP